MSPICPCARANTLDCLMHSPVESVLFRSCSLTLTPADFATGPQMGQSDQRGPISIESDAVWCHHRPTIDTLSCALQLTRPVPMECAQ